MNKELIFNGYIYCENMTAQQLEDRLHKEIFLKIGHWVKNKIEIYFGRKLHKGLCVEGLLNRHSKTVDGFTYYVSHSMTPYGYSVFLKHDHEDQMDAMATSFPIYIKKQLNDAFGVSSISIDISGKIKKVIFNPPATIIFWKDGSKTVVKCDGEAFDPEKGMAMAISRKVLGDSYEYYNVFEKWCKKYKQPAEKNTQEVAAKYMTPPTIPESAVEEVKRYTKIESGDSDAD